jgi:heterotetrameric sarcosine oxidase delta subunit
MSFLIACPNCGSRSVYEFDFGGEYIARPDLSASSDTWAHFTYFKANIDGQQIEWWYHRQGCKLWFLAERNTITNNVNRCFWPVEFLKTKRQGERHSGTAEDDA